MKTLIQHITERLQLNKDRVRKIKYEYCPENRKELRDIIKDITNKHSNDKIIDLNIIDTSKITDMSELFLNSTYNYNISEWNVSNVVDMSHMFNNSNFNNDISQWDVSHVENMRSMFIYSQFNGDISRWNVSNVKVMSYMFSDSQFNQDISQWDVSQVEKMFCMFENSNFNQDLTPWKNKIKNKDQLLYIQDYIK